MNWMPLGRVQRVRVEKHRPVAGEAEALPRSSLGLLAAGDVLLPGAALLGRFRAGPHVLRPARRGRLRTDGVAEEETDHWLH